MTPIIQPSSAATPGAQSAASLKKAAQGFEAALLRVLMGEMRKAKLGDELFGSSATESMRELADARTADAIAALGRFGIANMVEQQFRGRTGGSS